MLDKYAKVMMETAERFAQESYARRLKVGAVLAKDGRILVTGYNGTISGLDNNCEDYDWDNVEPFEEEIPVSINRNHDFSQISRIIKLHETLGFAGYDESNGIKVEEVTQIEDYLRSYNLKFKVKGIRAGLKTKDTVLHAEENILAYAAKEGIKTKGSTLYCTALPCIKCARMLAQAGIVKVVYRDMHESKSNGTNLDFFNEAGLELEQYVPEE